MKSCPRCLATYPDDYTVCPKDGARLAGSALWKPGSIIRGKYKLLAKIGEGGMASVYRAHHELLNEPRALKVIGWDLARDQQFVQRFKNEAIITRKLQHPNAVRVDDLDIAEDGRPFIAMELVQGESLKARMIRSGPLAAAEVLGIAHQVCEALEAAHALGLIHRDIKPDNIVLVPRPEAPPLVKILDFGIARLKEAAPDAGRAGVTLTETGAVIGTPDYMSPEQAMGKRGDELDGRSDLYSLGIVMYRMLTGELPFKAETTVEMILHHIQTAPRPPQHLKPALGIPESISTLVMKALAKNRDERHTSAAAMAQAIRQSKESLTLVGPPPVALSSSPGTTVSPAAAASARLPKVQATPGQSGRSAATIPPSRPRPEARRFPTFRVVGGAILVLLVLAYAAALRRRQAPQQPPAPVETAMPSELRSTPSTDAVPPDSEANTTQQPAPDETDDSPVDSPSPAQSSPVSSPQQEVPAAEQRLSDQAATQTSQAQEIRRLQEAAGRDFAHGDYLQAARKFRRILALDPQNKRARTGLQMCAQMLKRGKAARRQPRP